MPFIYDIDIINSLYAYGLHLDTRPHGGVQPHHYFGQSVDVIGHHVARKNGRLIARDITFPAVILDTAAHLDKRDEEEEYSTMFPVEGLDLMVGFRSPDQFLKSIGFDRQEDFVTSDFRAIPTVRARTVGDVIVGYGHDNAACTFAGLEAFLTASPQYVSVFVGFDCEETEAQADESAGGMFFERVLDAVITRVPQPEGTPRRRHVTGQLQRQIAARSLAVSADGDVAFSHFDKEHGSFRNVNRRPYMGSGIVLPNITGAADGFKTSPYTMTRIIEIARQSKAAFDITNGSRPPEDRDSERTHAEYLARRGFPVVEMGPPIYSMHAPSEVLHKGDLFATTSFYRAFFDRPFRKNP
jgi:aspartyl aminopeptidase